MKKMILLFTMIAAGQLYGMENPQPELSTFQNLPNEVKNLIILAFAQSGNDLDSTVKNIKIVSLTNKTLNRMINLNDLKSFTAIVHWLTEKFRQTGPYVVAEIFKTPTAEQYMDLYNKLETSVSEGNLASTKQLITIGADPNAITSRNPIMYWAMRNWAQEKNQDAVEIIEFLLENGAYPSIGDLRYTSRTTLETFNTTNNWKHLPGYERVKKAFEKAVAKSGFSEKQ